MARVPRPIDENWFRREFEALKSKVEDLARARRLGSSTVEGDLKLSPGSSFSAADADGTLLQYIGAVDWGPPWGKQPTVRFNRADGSIALGIDGANPDRQYIAIKDRSGNTVFADDTASGQGLARPWLPIPWRTYPSTSTSSADFQTVAMAVLRKQHPKLDIDVWTTIPAGATAEYRVIASTYTGLVTLFTGSAGEVLEGFTSWSDLTVPGDYDDEIYLLLQVRLASGTGPVSAEYGSIWARQT